MTASQPSPCFGVVVHIEKYDITMKSTENDRKMTTGRASSHKISSKHLTSDALKSKIVITEVRLWFVRGGTNLWQQYRKETTLIA